MQVVPLKVGSFLKKDAATLDRMTDSIITVRIMTKSKMTSCSMANSRITNRMTFYSMTNSRITNRMTLRIMTNSRMRLTITAFIRMKIRRMTFIRMTFIRMTFIKPLNNILLNEVIKRALCPMAFG